MFIPVKLTKRLILSKLAGIFYPVGAGAAVLVKPKIAMQELWQPSLGWDNEVPPEVKRKSMRLFEEMVAPQRPIRVLSYTTKCNWQSFIGRLLGCLMTSVWCMCLHKVETG